MGKVSVVKIKGDTPYLTGVVEAQCLQEGIYNLIYNNNPGALELDIPDPTWQEDYAMTT